MTGEGDIKRHWTLTDCFLGSPECLPLKQWLVPLLGSAGRGVALILPGSIPGLGRQVQEGTFGSYLFSFQVRHRMALWDPGNKAWQS